jgi:probable rRNA maturation factor
MDIDINWEKDSFSDTERQKIQNLLEKGLKAVLSLCNKSDEAEISLSLVTDAQIRQLNRDYRGMDRPTDVLSFALKEDNPLDPQILGFQDNLLGDIIISVERARCQAVEYGHSFERELLYLAIHGTLHLLGFNHKKEEEQVIMRTKEEEVLNFLGLNRDTVK